MADTVTYKFTANHATELWSTDPAKMVDGTEASYASTSTDGDIQCLITNECVGTDLGAISKVEIAAYAYSDDNDQLILRPVFGGAADGDDHSTVPGVDHRWGDWQEITDDPNSPSTPVEECTEPVSGKNFATTDWLAQTFTPSVTHDLLYVDLKLRENPSGGSTGTLTLSIRATDVGEPTGNDLASSTLPASEITQDWIWHRFAFSAYGLTQGTLYALVLRDSNGNIGAGKCIQWVAEASVNYYADGQGFDSDDSGDTWGSGGLEDFGFKEGGAWSWPDIQNLDCDVEQNDVSKGNLMHCGMVQIQVTYTAEAAGNPWYAYAQQQ